MAQCPNKSHKFYTNLLSHFNNDDNKAFEVWIKTGNIEHNKPFLDWYGEGNVDSFGNPVLVDNLYYQNDKGKKLLVDDLLNTIEYTDLENLEKLYNKVDDTVKILKRKSDQYYNEYDKLVNEVQDIVTKFGVIYGKKGNEVYTTKIKDLRAELEKALSNNETERALGLFVRNAIKEINDSYRKFNEMIDSNDVTVSKLRLYENYISAYDILDEIDALLNKDKNYEILNKDSRLRGITKDGLSQAIKNKNSLKKQYTDLLKDFISGGLAKYSKFYNKQDFMRMLENADRDINSFELWLDFMGDSEDGVTAVLAKIVDSKNREVMREQEEFQKHFYKELDKFNQLSKGDKSLDPKKLYSNLLEKDNKGRETGYLVSKYNLAEFEQEKDKKYEAYASIEDTNSNEYEIKRKEYYKWLDENTQKPYTKEYYAIWNNLTKEAKEAKSNIFAKMKAIKDKYPKKNQNYSEQDAKDLKYYETELKELSSLFNSDGSLKDDLSEEQTKIIKSIQDFNKAFAKAHKFVFDYNGFEIARRRAEEELSDDEYKIWLSNNADIKDEKISPNKRWKRPIVKEEYENKAFELNTKGYPVPNENWINPQHEFIKDNPLYQFIDEAYKFQQSKLPTHARRGYKLPMMRKSGLVERIIDQTKEEGIKKIGSVIKENILDNLQYRKGDTSRGEIFDVNDNPIDTIPINYINELPVDEMSFDLGKLFTYFNYTTTNYQKMNEILDFSLGVKELIENRGYTRVDNLFQPILNKITWKNDQGELKDLNEQKQFIEGKKSNVAKQLDYFLQMQIFGKKDKDLGYTMLGLKKLDNAKLIQMVNNYTSYSMLGLNMLAANVNALQGNVQNIIEAGAGEFYSLRNYFKSGKVYSKNLMGILGDIGDRSPKNIISLLNRKFDTLGKYDDELKNSSNNDRFKKLINSSSVFFLTNVGEHMMQSRVMLSMLDAKTPLGSDGQKIEGLNSMLDAYTIENGELKLDERVTNFSTKEQDTFARQLQTVIRRTHGNYNSMTAVAWQQHAVMRMIGAMRKWIRSTYMKRWARRRKNEFLESETEGFYVTTRKYLKHLITDLKTLKWELLSKDWDNLEDFQKANLRRAVGEAAALAATFVAIMLFTKDIDDDDEDYDNVYLAYLATRLNTETFFYLNPLDTLKIIKSPAASISLIEDTIRLMRQIVTEPTERYVKGRREGQLKINKQIEDIIPYVKQIDRISQDGLKEQLTWFNLK